MVPRRVSQLNLAWSHIDLDMAPTWGLSVTRWTPYGPASWDPDGFRKLVGHGSYMEFDMAPTWNHSVKTYAPHGLPLWGPNGIGNYVGVGPHGDRWGPRGTFL